MPLTVNRRGGRHRADTKQVRMVLILRHVVNPKKEMENTLGICFCHNYVDSRIIIVFIIISDRILS